MSVVTVEHIIREEIARYSFNLSDECIEAMRKRIESNVIRAYRAGYKEGVNDTMYDVESNK